MRKRRCERQTGKVEGDVEQEKGRDGGGDGGCGGRMRHGCGMMRHDAACNSERRPEHGQNGESITARACGARAVFHRHNTRMEQQPMEARGCERLPRCVPYTGHRLSSTAGGGMMRAI